MISNSRKVLKESDLKEDQQISTAESISSVLFPMRLADPPEFVLDRIVEGDHQSIGKEVLGPVTILNETSHLYLKIGKTGLEINNLSSSFQGYDHATWYVSNAKQAASYFISYFGFEWVAYKGLETGSKIIAAHVVKNGDVVFQFISALADKSEDPLENKILDDIHKFIRRHGDAVKDISFRVDDVKAIYANAIKYGARRVIDPHEVENEDGVIECATIEVFDDVFHTLVDKSKYHGVFLPGYVAVKGNQNLETTDALAQQNLPLIRFGNIDHCVQNEDWDNLEGACNLYSSIFGFHKFWSVDEKDVSTEFSALRSIVMTSANETIKMPINEPAYGICKSQIEEFIQFHNGAGVQHIALSTTDIIATVGDLKLRGAQFIRVPPAYYEKLSLRLHKVNINIQEDIEELAKLGILVDFDEKGYLLQLFTKPLTDRPTFFLEIIQRHNHNGFGAGNFKALFETIESEQRLRGTLEK